jgi:hypothetical protein
MVVVLTVTVEVPPVPPFTRGTPEELSYIPGPPPPPPPQASILTKFLNIGEKLPFSVKSVTLGTTGSAACVPRKFSRLISPLVGNLSFV